MDAENFPASQKALIEKTLATALEPFRGKNNTEKTREEISAVIQAVASSLVSFPRHTSVKVDRDGEKLNFDVTFVPPVPSSDED